MHNAPSGPRAVGRAVRVQRALGDQLAVRVRALEDVALQEAVRRLAVPLPRRAALETTPRSTKRSLIYTTNY